MSNAWSLAAVWNKSFETLPRRPLVPRDYIYASELLGHAPDVYLKMMGTKPTNPPDGRALRKMEAGNLAEHIIKIVMIRAGLLESHQVAIKTQLPGLCAVSGRCDFISKANPDFEMAEHELSRMDLPEFFMHTAREIISTFKMQYAGQSLVPYLVEAKSVAGVVFDRNEAAGKPNDHHACQSYHYGNYLNLPSKLIYMCRDDMRLAEYHIQPDDRDVAKQYVDYVTMITDHYNHREMPPVQAPIIYDYEAFKFSKNWRLEWSNYLTLHTGIESAKLFYEMYAPKAKAIQRVYARFVKGENITKKNLEVVAESGFADKWEELVQLGKIAGVAMEEDEEVMA